MKALTVIQKDLEFNSSLSSLIEVLKNIAVAQFRIMEKKLRTFELLFTTIESFFELVDCTQSSHPFVNSGTRPQAVVAVTSDSGLLGGLNMQVISGAISELEKKPGKIIVVGERGKMYLQGTGIAYVGFGGIRDEERYNQAMQLRDYLIEKVGDGSFGAIKVVYPRPLSFTVQRVEMVDFLPFIPSESQRPLEGPAVILESELGDMIEYLVHIWMGQRLYEIFGFSRMAEFAARFMHLEGSHQRLKEIDAKNRMEYFKVRHEIIDRNMRELFSARLLYAG